MVEEEEEEEEEEEQVRSVVQQETLPHKEMSATVVDILSDSAKSVCHTELEQGKECEVLYVKNKLQNMGL